MLQLDFLLELQFKLCGNYEVKVNGINLKMIKMVMEEEVEKGIGKVDCGKDIVYMESDLW